MITRQGWGFLLALMLTVGSSAQAEDKTAVVAQAAKLLEEIAGSTDSGIPAQFLQEAQGILIVPHVVEMQVGVGRLRGHGVCLVRKKDGAWGNPEPVTASGGNVGAKAGRMVSDMVIIYRTQDAIRNQTDRFTFSISAELSAALGLRNRFSGPEVESGTKKDVLTYTRRRGMLVGVGVGHEHKPTPPTSLPDTETPSVAGQPAVSTTNNTPVDITKPNAPTAKADAHTTSESPEVARLKTVLTAMTNPPLSHVADTGTKDPNVRPTSGTPQPAARQR